MGLTDSLRKFVTGETKEEQQAHEQALVDAPVVGQNCALCNKGGADKRWGGAYWHKKCMRFARQQAKKMI